MRRIEEATLVDLTWPYLRERVSNPIRARLARKLFLDSVRELPLSVTMPNGDIFGQGHGSVASDGYPRLRINEPRQFFMRLGRHGSLGFGESYILGLWDMGDYATQEPDRSDEAVAWLATYTAYLEGRESKLLNGLRRIWRQLLPIAERNSTDGARRNVQAHYDLDPRLFELFLDESMTYSSAWFQDGDDLPKAQAHKLDAILDMAHVGANTRLLDVGFGFGSLAFRAASERSAVVTGITLSARQLEYAAARARVHGLRDRVTFLLEDYRNHVGLYDAIASVEMIEAVGAAYWTEYFSAMDRLLSQNGFFALQVITFPHRRMLASLDSYSWVDRYIFPGGQFPSLHEISRILEQATSLEIIEQRRLSESYARTLREWRHRFIGSLDAIRAMGFDEAFVRLWILYLSYFEAGFRARYCDVWQLGMRKRT